MAEVHRRVAAAAERSGRQLSDVQLVAVSKNVSPEVTLDAYRLGLRHFGENRVQEFRAKREVLRSLDAMEGARWHLIGHLQSNKARVAVELSDIIQSVDSVRLAQVLDRCAEGLGKRQQLLLQVDYSQEPQRSGFAPEELDRAVGEMVGLGHLEIQGLMTIAPVGLDEEGLRRVFRQLRGQQGRLAQRYPEIGWRHLSMGMTNDFEIAIEEGATIVRIGRAIFGERPRRD